jgi:uncharacterized repeat protein (TIGR03803 family)
VKNRLQPWGWTSSAFLDGVQVLAIVVALAIIAIPSVQAQTFAVLYDFSASTGAWPFGALVRDSAGNLYGTTTLGGGFLGGAVFEVNSSGETVLHSFSGGQSDGSEPYAAVTRTSTGIIYGTTFGSGSTGCGIVFRLLNGETVLHNFAGGTLDGCNPYGGVIRKNGFLYGTTFQGGTFGFGTVWKLSSKGVETVLHHFSGGAADGAYPAYGNLITDAAGNLYGTTDGGGPSNSGTVFKIDPSGNLTILYNFTGGTDGGDPDGSLLRDASGNLYGTTVDGGTTGNGTVWKLSAAGTETVIHSFSGADGGAPQAGVVRDGSGNLYGVAFNGGTYGGGVIWKLTKHGVFTVLHNFNCATDGCNPVGGLVRDKVTGNLFGTAAYGLGGYGTVWQLTP